MPYYFHPNETKRACCYGNICQCHFLTKLLNACVFTLHVRPVFRCVRGGVWILIFFCLSERLVMYDGSGKLTQKFWGRKKKVSESPPLITFFRPGLNTSPPPPPPHGRNLRRPPPILEVYRTSGLPIRDSPEERSRSTLPGTVVSSHWRYNHAKKRTGPLDRSSGTLHVVASVNGVWVLAAL